MDREESEAEEKMKKSAAAAKIAIDNGMKVSEAGVVFHETCGLNLLDFVDEDDFLMIIGTYIENP